MKKTLFFLLGIFLVFSSCKDSIAPYDSQQMGASTIRKTTRLHDNTIRIVMDNPQIFGSDVPIFGSREEMDSLLSIIEDIDSVQVLVNFCTHNHIDNRDMSKYINYCRYMEMAFGEGYNTIISGLSSHSAEAFAFSQKLLDSIQNYVESVNLIDRHGIYMVEPSVDFDIELLRNDHDFLICGSDAYYFTEKQCHIIPVDSFANGNTAVMTEIATYESNSSNEVEDTKYLRRIEAASDPVEVKEGKKEATYKLEAVFKTHYDHNLFKENVEMHSYVWVKNYKKTGCCYCIHKMQNYGKVTYNVDWKNEDTYWRTDYFLYHSNFKIYTDKKHAIKKYSHDDITVYNGCTMVSSNEYYITELIWDISNDYNSINYTYEH